MSKHHLFKLIVLLYVCAALLSCVFAAGFENKGRVDVVLFFDKCSDGGMDPINTSIILKPGNTYHFGWKSFFFGIFLTGVKCYIYVLGPYIHPHLPPWTNLMDTITITRPGGITHYNPFFLDNCQQPCRIRTAPDYSFVIL